MPIQIEETRPEPDFEVMIRLSPEKVSHGHELAKALQDVYDIAVNSMDFGSGFLGTEELLNLRILGFAIGAPPLHYKSIDRGSRTCQHDWARPDAAEKDPCTCGALTFYEEMEKRYNG